MGLLIIRLLTLINNEKTDSTFFHIASTLIENYSLIAHTSISEMAKICTVSKSTMSKFARKIGFDDYYDLKDHAPFVEDRYQNKLNYLTNIISAIETKGIDAYFEAVEQDIQAVRESLDMAIINEIAQDLIKYKKVASFGLLFSESAALDLQYKLAYNGKFIYTFQDDKKQEEFIRNAQEDTLIIIFSNSGNFLRQQQLEQGNPQKNLFRYTKAKLIAITSDKTINQLSYVDQALTFPHSTSIQTHAFLYQIIMDIIVSRYRYYIQQDSIQNE
ncbi:MurR/RpiR family transcriptional regulator [Enterococcus sp. MJM12]|uniref:MurR/RpiR family transcriptional regulator n=1 Tax=Candidatus Enterococcus myersii TaxID=2815322 RepID=A0ABS3H7M2_9ENTE|nr:MurR/RpiR family transcriptional regulator [Enterococcus sp. MJM12]MBO0449456.1 MurR/RpiR family transcriptional regulator [Enterococcus sp. MJM12]